MSKKIKVSRVFTKKYRLEDLLKQIILNKLKASSEMVARE